jgi:hypothetical protein
MVRDVPQLGINIPAPALLRFWTMVAVVTPAPERPARWMLSRTGIINVYQYGDETLDFGAPSASLGRSCTSPITSGGFDAAANVSTLRGEAIRGSDVARSDLSYRICQFS